MVVAITDSPLYLLLFILPCSASARRDGRSRVYYTDTLEAQRPVFKCCISSLHAVRLRVSALMACEKGDAHFPGREGACSHSSRRQSHAWSTQCEFVVLCAESKLSTKLCLTGTNVTMRKPLKCLFVTVYKPWKGQAFVTAQLTSPPAQFSGFSHQYAPTLLPNTASPRLPHAICITVTLERQKAIVAITLKPAKHCLDGFCCVRNQSSP